MNRRHFIACTGAAVAAMRMRPSLSAELGVPPQPYFAAVNRALEALAKLGAPIAEVDAAQIGAMTRQNDGAAVEVAEKILRNYTLADLSITADGALHVAMGGAQRRLIEQGWRVFLVRVANPGGRTDDFTFSTGLVSAGASRMARERSVVSLSQRADLADTLNKAPLIERLWLQSQLYEATPIVRNGQEIPVLALPEISVEYRVIQVFSRDAGARTAKLTLFSFPKRAGGLGPSKGREFDFECTPSRIVALSVLDSDDRSCVASLTIKDKLGHVYPPQVMRLAPDMSFHQHIYRADGETLRLADGEYTVESKRGPEYLSSRQTVTIDAEHGHIDVRLQRWIDPAQWGWYSGDTHIHAAGCAHYQVPTEGVTPETMIRHVRGEGLSIGAVLSWGPGWYYQKEFFTGNVQSPTATLEHPELQRANNATWQPHATAKDAESLLRYDVEVSGFPSSLSGHLILLRLKQQDYPGTRLIEDWPSWNLPILQWARKQGSVVGFAHCGAGMAVSTNVLPNYEVPLFDSIGTNEAIVDVTHDACDFLSGCELEPAQELNAWYHLLNCGFRLAMLGETDYPCISGERPGMGRSYVKLDHRPIDDEGYNAWIDGIKAGRLYCGDGRSHFLEFTVQGRNSGQEVTLRGGGSVDVRATVAAWLPPGPTQETRAIRAAPTPAWHLERARIADGREVFIELVINGVAVDKVALLADGSPREIRLKFALVRSAWIALRIMPSGHTHPVFVHVGGKPIRASRRSAQWLRACVDKLWEVKSPFMRESEWPAAAAAFDHARRTYDRLATESDAKW